MMDVALCGVCFWKLEYDFMGSINFIHALNKERKNLSKEKLRINFHFYIMGTSVNRLVRASNLGGKNSLNEGDLS